MTLLLPTDFERRRHHETHGAIAHAAMTQGQALGARDDLGVNVLGDWHKKRLLIDVCRLLPRFVWPFELAMRKITRLVAHHVAKHLEKFFFDTLTRYRRTVLAQLQAKRSRWYVFVRAAEGADGFVVGHLVSLYQTL